MGSLTLLKQLPIRFTVPLLYLVVMCPPSTANQSVVDTSSSPHAKLESVNIDDVEWTSGFWTDRFDLVSETTLMHLYKLMADPERGALRNLEIAAGLREGPYAGNNWMDAWVYKWIEAASAVYAATKDEKLNQLMDRIISVIAKAQESDGYIASQNIVRNRPCFQRPNHHEVYVMGHLLTAAVVHHRCTGKSIFLDVAKKTGKFLYRQFKNKNPQMAHFPFNPSVIMGAVELHRETGEQEYLELAKTVVDMRGAFKGGSDQCQDRVPLRKETEVVGHAVFYTYLYSGAADVFMETGDTELLAALERLWKDLVEHKLYITGGTCALYRGFSIRNGSVYTADDVHEAVGPRYYLPKTPAYNETCGQVGNFMWNWRMLAIEAKAKYADMMEREMYNGFLPGISVDGRSFSYTNPLRWYGEEQELWSQDSLRRHQPGAPKPHRPNSNYGTCCPSNVLRTLAEMQDYFYSISGDTLWIHHYGGNRLDNGTYKIEQKTNYPWDGNIHIDIESVPKDSVIHLRIPGWADTYSIQINGTPFAASSEPGTYVAVQHKWKQGDTITLNLPLDVRFMRAHRKVDSAHNQIAVARGPILYCLESPDLPQGVDVSEIIIPRNIDLTPTFESACLGGVVTLSGRALRLPKDDSHLYTELGDEKLQPIDVKLIPYFAWMNRGVSQMTLWLPIDW